jgi:hypothetical protein
MDLNYVNNLVRTAELTLSVCCIRTYQYMEIFAVCIEIQSVISTGKM